MRTLIVYESHYGNTAQIARALAERLGQGGTVELAAVGVTAHLDLAPIDLLLVGGPTHYWRPTPALAAWLDALPPDALRGCATVAFDTHYRHWLSGSAARAIARQLRQKGGRQLARPESFFVQRARIGPLEEGEVARASAWAADLLSDLPLALRDDLRRAS